MVLDAALRGCFARFPLNNTHSLTASTMVTTRIMAHGRRYLTRRSRKNRKAVCHGDPFTRRSTPAAKPYLVTKFRPRTEPTTIRTSPSYTAQASPLLLSTGFQT